MKRRDDSLTIKMEETGQRVASGSNGAQGTVDFNLHGLVGIRLLDAEAADVAAVSRQLGPIRGSLQRAPEIVIRFVDQMDTPALRYAELKRSAFSSEQFFVLRSKYKAPARVQLPLDQVGGPCEIVCEHGLPAVPFLIPIVNLTALANGALPIHAGAFIYEGAGTLVTGWSKGGKTEALMGFMARGATYIADEWTYLHDGGRQMSGIPEPIRVWDWHLREMPSYRSRLRRRERLRLATLGTLMRALDWATPHGNGGGPLPMLHRVKPLLKKQQGANIPPQRFFGEQRCASSAAVDRLFFVVSSESPEIEVAPIDPLEVAERMVFSLQEEQRQFLSLYRQFRFAFPDAANELIESSPHLQARRLQEMLAGKEAYVVTHPYPVPIKEMVTAMERVIT